MGTATVEKSPPTGEGLTFEKVWASIQESRQEWKEQQKELNRQMEETDRRMQETDRKISSLGDRIGELIEHLAASNILEKFEEFGYDFDQVSRNISIRDENKQSLAQIDLLLENGEYAAVVEVKSLVTTAKVKKHKKRMEIVRTRADKRGDRRKYIAAMAGALYEDAARDYALKSGMYVVEQTGDNVQIKAPPELAVW